MPRSGLDIMWSETLTVFARAERQQREVFQLTETGWEPPIDVLETETGLLVIVALPGVQVDEMETVHRERRIDRQGHTTLANAAEASPRSPHRVAAWAVRTSAPLPHGAYQLVGQEHTDGCLVLTLKRLI